MAYNIENETSELLIYDKARNNINYFPKSELSVSASGGIIIINRTVGDLVSIIFSEEASMIDQPSTNSIHELVTTIHSWIISGTSSSNTDIKRVSYVLTAAQVLTLNSVPVTIVSGVAGKELQVVSAAMRIKFNSAAYATNTTLAIGTTTDPDGQAQLNCLAAVADIRGTMGLVTTGATANLHTGENIVVSVETGNPTTGDSQVVVDITYREIDL
mgnify:CR=1 FL=1